MLVYLTSKELWIHLFISLILPVLLSCRIAFDDRFIFLEEAIIHFVGLTPLLFFFIEWQWLNFVVAIFVRLLTIFPFVYWSLKAKNSIPIYILSFLISVFICFQGVFLMVMSRQ